jgi:hypothetical protein
MEKEMKIIPPEGYEIDKENSTFECIKFKPVIKRWRDDSKAKITGYYMMDNKLAPFRGDNVKCNFNVFATKELAKSALAMARISQIMANDERFGGPVTDNEWNNSDLAKYTIFREVNHIERGTNFSLYRFLSFHAVYQRDLFLEENEDLIKDYLMMN